jgi:hypothetical protein
VTEDFDQLNENNPERLSRFPEVNCFVLIRFQFSKNKKSLYYVGRVVEPKTDEEDLKYLS